MVRNHQATHHGEPNPPEQTISDSSEFESGDELEAVPTVMAPPQPPPKKYKKISKQTVRSMFNINIFNLFCTLIFKTLAVNPANNALTLTDLVPNINSGPGSSSGGVKRKVTNAPTGKRPKLVPAKTLDSGDTEDGGEIGFWKEIKGVDGDDEKMENVIKLSKENTG